MNEKSSGRKRKPSAGVTVPAGRSLRSARGDVLFQRLVESVHDYAIFLLDPNGHVSTWNVGAQRIKGYEASEIVGRHFSAFYPEEDVQSGKCERALETASREGRFEDEGWRVRKDGTRFWASVLISVVRDTNGELLGFSKVTRDLSERKRIEEERSARIVTESGRRTKDELFAMLGHELRNPLAAILAALQLIRGNGAMTREHEVVERHAKHMARLLDDLLQMSELAEGQLALERSRFDLREAVADGLEIAGPLIEKKQHTAEVHLPDAAVLVEGDRARLTQVIAKIVFNAAKYTDTGGQIDVSLDTQGDDARVQVSDNGRGIEAALMPQLFDRFVQGEQGLDRSQGGLGLGLAFVRMLVHMHGGTVKAASPRVGAGSTFTVHLPLAKEPTVERASGVGAAVGLRVLIVDDNEDAASLLGAIVERAGHTVQIAHDPASALAVVNEFQPQLAVLDIGLPTMDGYTLAGHLRAALAPAPLRLIALTGYGQPRDRERSREAGFAAHLVKPVVAKDLLEAISASDA